MNRLFTSRRQRTDASASGQPELRRAAAVASPAGRLAMRLRRAVPPLLVLGAGILFQGCAKPYGAALRQYNEAPVCCASLAELPVEPLHLGDTKSFNLGGNSPAYRFTTGKSYFRAFSLPQGPYPYKVTARSFLIGDDLKTAYIFFPKLMTLDENRRVIRTTGPETFTLQQAGYIETMEQTAGLLHKLEGELIFPDGSKGERYLVVMTTDDLLMGMTAISAAGEVPLLTPGYAITVSGKRSEAHVPHAPAGRVSISLAPLAAETPVAGTANATGGRAEKDAPPRPEIVTARLANGKIVGALELGKTDIDSARQIFEKAGAMLGEERQNAASITVGTAVLAPKRLFAPPGSLQQLYFDDNGALVLFVDGAPANFPPTGKEFLQRFSGARESGRTLGSYEVQVPLDPCVTLVAVFRTVSDTLESAGYGYGCRVK
ncbi:MAG TPA: MalM family protein [Geobacteraceae bacterium]